MLILYIKKQTKLFLILYLDHLILIWFSFDNNVVFYFIAEFISRIYIFFFIYIYSSNIFIRYFSYIHVLECLYFCSRYVRYTYGIVALSFYYCFFFFFFLLDRQMIHGFYYFSYSLTRETLSLTSAPRKSR